ETFDLIVKHNLYSFNADNPSHIVRSQIRRHCKGLDFPSSNPTKHFEEFGDGKFYFLANPIKAKFAVAPILKEAKTKQPTTSTINQQLKELHYSYHEALKSKILKGLKSLTPFAFELFSKKLLEVYGFHDMKVTHISKDGGIDGFGKLKIGLAEMNVAFQCKKWSTNSIHRPEVDKFRGAIQGEFEQGIFITTTSFASGAKAVSFKRGAVPIVLIDGEGIVALMIQKEFGVQKESMQVYTYALDLALTEED
ncbi:MAG: restriction endonuclease, partial [Chlorobium sp.]|nr:restriction endonuclease [Chlorobium sp.]